jgi:uncharacterized membrane protein YfcA
MTPLSSIFILITAFLTAMLSGIFGMAGGLVLMGALALVLPVSAAFATHGILQIVANGWRAWLHRRHVAWRIVGVYAAASIVAGVAVWMLALLPSKPVLFLLLGLVPMLVWLPQNWIALDASRPAHAFISGFLVTALNLSAGVAGPLLDIFFVRTSLDRHQIVATKAATQVFSHGAKIAVYGLPLLIGPLTSTRASLPPLWLFALAIPLSMAGTAVGGMVLDRMSDANFKRWTRWIVTLIGLFYLYQAWALWH